MQDLLKQAGWSDSDITSITPDWSPRQYWRVKRNDGATAVVLQGPIPDFRGHGLKEFIDIGAQLRALGLSVPEIYAADLEHARLLMEDFGSITIDTPSIETEAYEAAIDVLPVLRTAPVGGLQNYEDGYIYKKLFLFSDDPTWMDAWKQVEASLPSCPHVFSHMDYKAGNLFWQADRAGIRRVGILDYQAAQNAPFVYDAVILLEDARRVLKPALKSLLKARFRDALPDDWRPLMDVWYPVIAAQFHFGVLGQIRGKDNVDPAMPARLEAYLRDELQAPVLKPLYDWCRKAGILL